MDFKGVQWHSANIIEDNIVIFPTERDMRAWFSVQQTSLNQTW